MTLFHLWDLPGDVLAAPESASGLDRCNLSLSLAVGQDEARYVRFKAYCMHVSPLHHASCISPVWLGMCPSPRSVLDDFVLLSFHVFLVLLRLIMFWDLPRDILHLNQPCVVGRCNASPSVSLAPQCFATSVSPSNQPYEAGQCAFRFFSPDLT